MSTQDTRQRQMLTAMQQIATELREIRVVLSAAFPPADTRPFSERLSEVSNAILDQFSDEEKKAMGLEQ